MTFSSFHEHLVWARDNPGKGAYRPLLDAARTGRVGEEEIYAEMSAAWERRDFVTMGILLECVIAARPSTRFAPLLAQILDECSDEINNEDLVEVLDLMHDERSIPALQRAASIEFPRDSLCRWVNRKALAALSRFDDEQAWETIRFATESPDKQLQDEARRLIEVRRMEKGNSTN